MAAIENALLAPGLGFAACVLVLVAGCILPSGAGAATRAGWRSGLVIAERLLLAASVALVLAFAVGYAAKLSPGLGGLLTLPGLVAAAAFAGLSVGRVWRDVRFLQASLVLGFAMSATFLFVQGGAGLAGEFDWRREAAVAVGALLSVLVMHFAAILDARRRRTA